MNVSVRPEAPPQIGLHWSGAFDGPWAARNADAWMSSETRLFAIGSCFAVNFARWLIAHGMKLKLPPWGMHYNPATVFNEIACASGRSYIDLTWNLEGPDGKGRYIDAMRHTIHAARNDELEDLKREIKLQGEKMYREADAFLITLGLSEIWARRSSIGGGAEQIINRAPYKGAGTHEFENRFMRVDEIVQYLRDITDIIRNDKGDATPIVFTVSPIPLKTTSSGLLPQAANIRSKASLLAAVHEFIDDDTARRPAAYFPAYEIFLGSPNGVSRWQADLRHPTANAIDSVCREFVRNFAVSGFEIERGIEFTVPEVAA